MDYCFRLHDYWSREKIQGDSFIPAGSAASTIDPAGDKAWIFGGLMERNILSPSLYSFEVSVMKSKKEADPDIPERMNQRMFLLKNVRRLWILQSGERITK